MPRRGENIRKRKDGRWEARVKIYKDEKVYYKSIYAKTYREVKEKAANIKEVKTQLITSCNRGLTINEIANMWLKEKYMCCKYSTYIKYLSIYQKHIMPIVGNKTIDSITVTDYENIFYKSDNNFSESTLNTIKCVLVSILKYEGYSYQLPKSLMYQKYLTPPKKQIKIFTTEEQKILLTELLKDIDSRKLGIIICLFSGLRLGEICSLMTKDIDLKNKTILVRNTVQRIKNPNGTTTSKQTTLLISTPKTTCAARIIPISDVLLEIIKKNITENMYVINGSAVMEPRTYQYYFKRLLCQLNIEIKSFHTLRHTFATNCLACGMDVKCLSEILGHSDVQITLNKYVHPTIETKRNELNKYASIMGQYIGHS